MMKILKKLSTVCILAVILYGVGCNDELLNPTPKSILTTSNTYQTAKDMNSAVLGMYNSLQSKVQNDYLLMELPTDNLYAFYYALHPGLSEVEFLEVATDNDIVGNFWTRSYNAIFRANKILSNIDNPTDYTEAQKERYTGEAKFVRALFYFDLVRIFGDVPLILEQLSVEEASQASKTPKEQIISQIIQDLKDAIANLPVPSDVETGRASKAAAAGLLSKVYVHNSNWESAMQYLEQVINTYDYSLVDDFGDLFSLETEENSEVIFTVPFVAGTNGQGLSTRFAPHPGIYEVISGGQREVRPTWDLQKSYDEEDTRLPETIIAEYLPFNGTPGDELIYQPMISKYLVPHTRGSSGLDLPILRLGDIILLYAEALYKTENSTEALAQLNLIRERAFGDSSHNYQMDDFTDEESFMDLLLKERRLELAFENQRWFDLVRTGRFINELAEFEGEYSGEGNPEIIELNPQPYMQYFPIPFEQIQLAESGVLTQNEGY